MGGLKMPITFNADEIFEMAEEIERNGAKFYRKAAGNTKDKTAQKLLTDLAVMEDGHLKTFRDMREKLTDNEKDPLIYDPDNEAAQYLKAMADMHGCEGKISPIKELTGGETLKEVIEIALNAEKESVVFYFGLKSFINEAAGKSRVEKIINEEIGHINILNKKLLELL